MFNCKDISKDIKRGKAVYSDDVKKSIRLWVKESDELPPSMYRQEMFVKKATPWNLSLDNIFTIIIWQDGTTKLYPYRCFGGWLDGEETYYTLNSYCEGLRDGEEASAARRSQYKKVEKVKDGTDYTLGMFLYDCLEAIGQARERIR